MYINKKLIDIYNDIDAKTPTPGGGAIASIAATLGMCLVKMTGHYSVDKKAFAELSTDVQNKYNETMNIITIFRERLNELVDADMNAFENFMKVFKEKETDKYRDALQQCIDVPKEVIEKCILILESIPFIIENSNKFIVSDAVVAAQLLNAAIHSCITNIVINLKMVDDENVINESRKYISDISIRSNGIAKSIFDNFVN